VDRAGLRRKLLKAQAEAGDIVLLFGDESEALTHPYLAHAWAKRGADLRVPCAGAGRQGGDARRARLGPARPRRPDQPDQAQFGLHRPPGRTRPALGPEAGPGDAARNPGARQRPDPHQQGDPRRPRRRAHWLTVEWLPKYAPELNDIEPTWRDLKRHHLAHQTFTGPDDLDRAIHDAVTKLNAERNRDPLASQRRVLSRQLGGDIDWATPERGTSINVRFPLVV
jgi:hypothetical protein